MSLSAAAILMAYLGNEAIKHERMKYALSVRAKTVLELCDSQQARSAAKDVLFQIDNHHLCLEDINMSREQIRQLIVLAAGETLHDWRCPSPMTKRGVVLTFEHLN